jgi:hypothetical protein
MRKPPELVEPDERWQILIGDRERLAAVAARWETNKSTSTQVAEMLEICRALFVYSYFVYEFGAGRRGLVGAGGGGRAT